MSKKRKKQSKTSKHLKKKSQNESSLTPEQIRAGEKKVDDWRKRIEKGLLSLKAPHLK